MNKKILIVGCGHIATVATQIAELQAQGYDVRCAESGEISGLEPEFNLEYKSRELPIKLDCYEETMPDFKFDKEKPWQDRRPKSNYKAKRRRK